MSQHHLLRQRFPWHRRLHVEPLEERRLLAMITVDTELDSVDVGDGLTSLREAIAATNTMPGPDEIVFNFGHDGPATILLMQGELQITEAVTITGDGPDLLTIDGQHQSRIIKLDDRQRCRDLPIRVVLPDVGDDRDICASTNALHCLLLVRGDGPGAIAKDQVEAVRVLLEWGADPDAQRDGGTPLFIAATKKDLTSLRLLLDAGADLTVTKAWTETPAAKNDGELWPVMEDALARAYGHPSPTDAKERTLATSAPSRP